MAILTRVPSIVPVTPGKPFSLKKLSISIFSSAEGHFISSGDKSKLKKLMHLSIILHKELIVISNRSATFRNEAA